LRICISSSCQGRAPAVRTVVKCPATSECPAEAIIFYHNHVGKIQFEGGYFYFYL
jgi:hypothetical protein